MNSKYSTLQVSEKKDENTLVGMKQKRQMSKEETMLAKVRHGSAQGLPGVKSSMIENRIRAGLSLFVSREIAAEVKM